MLNHRPVIDVDGHVLMECVPDWTSYFPKDDGEKMERVLLANRSHPNDLPGSRERVYEGIRKRNKSAGGWDPIIRLKDMDSEGVDIAVLFGTEMTLNQEHYSPAVARGYNTWLADYCRADAKRLKGVSLLPLGNVEAARVELRRTVKNLGFVATLMRPSVEDRLCDNPAFHPLYAEAQDLDVPVMLHIPHGAKKALQQHFPYDFLRAHAAMHPFSSMLSIMDIIYGGVLDRFPRLRFGFMEGQVGWVPWFLWRLDEQYEEYTHRPGMALGLKKLPSEYLKEGRIFFSCDPEEKYLAFAAQELGDAIVWASDYPHSDGIFPGAVSTFLEQPGLTPEQKTRILSDNSLALLHGRG